MSYTEILVVIGGLALGYWVVTKLIDDLNRDQKNPPGSKSPPNEPASPAAEPGPPWHEVLEVPPDATARQIRDSYELLMQQYHPDKVAALGEDLKTLAERKSREINSAYLQALLVRGEKS